MNTLLIQQFKALTENVNNSLTNVANLLGLINQSCQKVDWVGVYLYDPKSNALNLGPYQGPLACNMIPNGRGVCGKASQTRHVQLVSNVNKFPDYIACNSHTKSELVIPLLKRQNLIGVLDLDSNQLNAFNIKDQKILKIMTQMLLK